MTDLHLLLLMLFAVSFIKITNVAFIYMTIVIHHNDFHDHLHPVPPYDLQYMYSYLRRSCRSNRIIVRHSSLRACSYRLTGLGFWKGKNKKRA